MNITITKKFSRAELCKIFGIPEQAALDIHVSEWGDGEIKVLAVKYSWEEAETSSPPPPQARACCEGEFGEDRYIHTAECPIEPNVGEAKRILHPCKICYRPMKEVDGSFYCDKCSNFVEAR